MLSSHEDEANEADRVAQFLLDGQSIRPETPGEAQGQAPGAPAQLLGEEITWVIGACPTREDQWYGFVDPAMCRNVDTGIGVFRMGDWICSTDGVESCAPVDGVTAYAQGWAPFVAARLHDAVVILQQRPGALFCPCLVL